MRYLLFLIMLFTGASNASTLVHWQYQSMNGYTNPTKYTSKLSACKAYNTSPEVTYRVSGSNCYGTVYGNETLVSYLFSTSTQCEFGDTGTACNASCNAPNTMENGQCVTPPPDSCAAKSGTSGTHKKVWPSESSYSSLGETTNNDGCMMTIDTMSCGLDGASGKYGCFGLGTYTGSSAPPGPSDSTSCAGGADPSCETPPPVVSTQSQSCTPNTDGNFTCTSTSGSNQYASSQCALGTVNGVTGFHCTKPAYQPGSSSNTKDDTVTTTANGDGTTTTTTTSTTNNTHCKAGACTTTTTTTTNNNTKDASGNVVSDDTTCSGPNCPKPTDETGQEEGEEEGEETGGEFTGPEVCDPAQGCIPTLSNPFGDDVTVVPGYGESFSKMWDGISDSPLISSVSDVSFPKGGSCPTYTASLWGSTLVVNQHCGVLQSVGGVLSAVFLAMWAFIAIRVFLSA